MTAPQHTATPKADRKDSGEDSGSIKKYKLQRCWFVGMGLLSSVGFVASQMSFAFAYSDADFLITDYAADSAAEAANYTVADTTFSLAEPAYQAAAASQPLPDTFIEAPATAAAESWMTESWTPASESWAPEPAAVMDESAFVEAAPVVAQPVQVAPVVSPQATATAAAESVAPAAMTTNARALQPTAPASAMSQQAATTSSTGIIPEVSAVAPPAFTVARKDSPTKISRRSGPLAGLMEASAVAAPVSAYVNGVAASRTPGVFAVANATTGEAGILAMDTSDVPAIEAAPAVEIAPPVVAPAAVPDVLPEPLPAPAEAAAPIVEIAPPVAEQPAPIQATELVPAALPEGTNLPEEYNSVFVDPTDYSVGATQAPEAGAPEIVVSEQSTGCKFTVGAGQAIPDGACGATTASGSNGLVPAPAPLSAPSAQQAPVASAPVQAPVAAPQQAPVASAPSVNVGPVSFSASGIRFSGPSTTAAGREYLNRSVRPLVNLQAAQQFIFPLAVPSPITSLFGFRIHPITGDQRFHAGTDIGAAQGTPVLAAQDGFVEMAGNGGGYGLMVELSHDLEETQLRSRYAHLADIFVEAGTEVKKGDVIGLVGSTGNSTGPHLHFEMMQATADGWVLVNADGLVQSSLANLVKALNNPMQAVSFNLSDFNLNRVDVSNTTAEPDALIDVSTPGQNGISFRPAQPNAS